MFLIGGPAFSGTTLLALLVSQNGLLCLDEPDFHNPAQSHRGIPFLEELFPDRHFPKRPSRRLDWDETVRLIEQCARAIEPVELGIKTCDWAFVGHAEVFKRLGYPVVCILRDIRDVLVRPLSPWLTEEKLNRRYRLVWEFAPQADLTVRYEELVEDPEGVLERISATLGHPLAAPREWDGTAVPRHMLKTDRHELLKSGAISKERVGLWKRAPRPFSEETRETARLMGY